MKKANPPVRLYTVMLSAVESGVAYGWRRAHKHVDNPQEDMAIESIVNAVMGDLSEVIDFD